MLEATQEKYRFEVAILKNKILYTSRNDDGGGRCLRGIQVGASIIRFHNEDNAISAVYHFMTFGATLPFRTCSNGRPQRPFFFSRYASLFLNGKPLVSLSNPVLLL